MAEAGRYRLLRVPRGANQLGRTGRLSGPDRRAVAMGPPSPESKERAHVGPNEEAGGRLAPKAAHSSPLAQPAFRRQTPEVRAVCIKVHVRIRAGGARQLASLPRHQAPGADKGEWKSTGGTGKFAGKGGSGWFQTVLMDG